MSIKIGGEKFKLYNNLNKEMDKKKKESLIERFKKKFGINQNDEIENLFLEWDECRKTSKDEKEIQRKYDELMEALSRKKIKEEPQIIREEDELDQLIDEIRKAGLNPLNEGEEPEEINEGEELEENDADGRDERE